MKRNMGNNDRVARLIVAAFFIVLILQGLINPGWDIAILALAAVFILTSVTGYCPLYALFHINSQKK